VTFNKSGASPPHHHPPSSTSSSAIIVGCNSNTAIGVAGSFQSAQIVNPPQLTNHSDHPHPSATTKHNRQRTNNNSHNNKLSQPQQQPLHNNANFASSTADGIAANANCHFQSVMPKRINRPKSPKKNTRDNWIFVK
jgi:hypothetical protein